ncbi:MAG: M23 family peptidase, partial [Xanthobacteraceae bacterium]
MGLVLLAAPAAADEFRTPAVSAVHVEWRAALDQLKSEISAQPELAERFTFSSRRRLSPSDPRVMPAFEQLNAVTSTLFPGIGQSPVPVLLPFDAASYLRDGADQSPPDDAKLANYQSGFGAANMFMAGQAGYDALFSLPRTVGDGPERVYAKPVEVQITGSVLVYDIEDRFAGKGERVRALADQFPDLRRVIREGFVRYRFTAFGVPYVVAIHCLDSVPRADRLACRE